MVTEVVTMANKNETFVPVKDLAKSFFICLVRMRGLEPPLPCEN